MTTTHTPTARQHDQREAMRATLITQGYEPAAVDTMLATPPTPEAVYRIRQAVAKAITAMRRDLPRSEKTWAPYLQLLVDGIPSMCP